MSMLGLNVQEAGACLNRTVNINLYVRGCVGACVYR